MVGGAPARRVGAQSTAGHLSTGVEDVHSQPRALPFVLLAVFAALSVGAIALSLSSAPPLAQEELQSAAKTTEHAPGFVLKDTNSVTTVSASGQPVAGGQPRAVVAFGVVYQAPDAVEETEVDQNGGNAQVIAIGDRAFRKTGSTWTELAANRGLGARAVATITAPLLGAAGATEVTRNGDRFTFVPADLHQLLTTVLGATATVSSPRFTAVVRDGVLTQESITARVGHQQLEVDLVFSSIGTAPRVEAPSSFIGSGGAPTTP